jgi:predicted deacylase
MVTRRTLVRVPHGGIFHPAVGIEALDSEVRGDTVLGTVVDPYTLEQVAEIRAPYARSALLQMRVLPSAVQPGEYAYIIADLDSAVAA